MGSGRDRLRGAGDRNFRVEGAAAEGRAVRSGRKFQGCSHVLGMFETASQLFRRVFNVFRLPVDAAELLGLRIDLREGASVAQRSRQLAPGSREKVKETLETPPGEEFDPGVRRVIPRGHARDHRIVLARRLNIQGSRLYALSNYAHF